jgi:peptidoglycan/LPS O-acetylase OafA/YrhL
MLVSSHEKVQEVTAKVTSIPRHLEFLDGFRAMAALYVVIHHASMHVAIEWNSLPQKIIYKLANEGHYAVDIFIVLSGFCLMLPIVRNNGSLKEGSWQFFLKRAKRILPPYYLALAFTLLLIYTLIGNKTGTHWDGSIPVTNWDIFTRLTLLQDVFLSTKSKINYAFWSISVEWRIYLLFPLLVVSWKKRGPFFTTFLAVVVSFALWFMLEPTGLNLGKTGISPHYIGLFCMGMLATQLAYAKQKSFAELNKSLPWLHLVIGSMLLTAIAHLMKEQWVLLDLMVGCTAAILLIALASGKLPSLHRILSCRPLVFIGTFAYSIYLVHAPLLQLISQYVLHPLQLSSLAGLIFMITAGTFLVVAASYLFYLVAEKPFINKKKLITGSKGMDTVSRENSPAALLPLK